MSNIIQLTFESQQTEQSAIAEFQAALRKYFSAASESEYESAIEQMDRARSVLILNFQHDLPAICALVDSANDGDAA